MTLRRALLFLATIFFIAAAVSWAFLDDAIAHWATNLAVDQARLIKVQKLVDIATLKFMSAVVGPVLLVAGWLMVKRNKGDRGRFIVGLGGTITITEYSIDLMKWLFGRLRPHQWLDPIPDPALWFAGGTSFPSGHAGYYTALASGLAIRFPRFAPCLLLMPGFVGIQRIMVDKHYLSDVLTSIGIACLAAAFLSNWLSPTAISRQM